ncbi:Calcium-binding mitochondrial carrier protein Aralar1, partial [Folsomia candida]
MEYNLNIEVAQVADRNRKLKMMAAALFGGVAQVALMHPMDTVKTRMQVMGYKGQVTAFPSLYKGSWDCCVKTLRQEGSFKLKVQTPETPQNYSGPMDCAKKLLANGGISNFYRGFWITYLRG